VTRFLSDSALERLREVADSPDLSGTRYRLVGKLGQGGMGDVYCVEDTELERRVALKRISVPDPDGAWTARLLQEARVIAKLEHPGIVPVHDAGVLPDGRPYYTMKLVQGKRLDEHVESVASLSDRLRLFLRISDAVAFAHARGVMHRDLKPANIMIGPFGEVLVMDWGLSKVLKPSPRTAKARAEIDPRVSRTDQSSLTAHGNVVGTPGYMSPEQLRSDPALDHRSDVYSLGAILQFLINAGNPQPIPRPLSAIRANAMAEDPAKRYPSVSDLATDVAHFLDGLAVSAYPEGPLARAWRWAVRNRTWILLLLAYMVVRTLLILFRPR
jgi:eukaryotic-like serine/threonine-protein kinase